MTRIVTTHQHAIMLFAKKGSVFFRKSLLFWLLFAVLLCYSCYTCHHFHGPRVGKFISVSVTICMMMCRLSLLSSSLRVGLEYPGLNNFMPTLNLFVCLFVSTLSKIIAWKVHFRFCHNLHDDVSSLSPFKLS